MEFPSVRAALRRIARALGSKIVVDAVGAPASGGVSLVTLRDVVNWAVSAPRVHREKKLTVTQTELEAALEAVRAVEPLLSTGGVSFDGNSKVVTTTANKRRRV